MGGTSTNCSNYYKTYTPKIKFTMEHSLKELPFLDILIKNVNGKIITDIYHKPTDTQQYLHYRSHHSQNCIKSIPYTLTRRIHTIITDKNLKKHASKNYTQSYTREVIQQHQKVGISRKNTPKRIKEPEKTQQRKTPSIRRNL